MKLSTGTQVAGLKDILVFFIPYFIWTVHISTFLSYVVTRCEAMSITTMGEHGFQSVDGVMSADHGKIRTAYEKISPYIQEVFTELANHDVRFEFDPVSLYNPRCTMISKHVYSVVCFLKRMPQEYLKVEGSDSDGALTVRLSRSYVQR